MAAGLDELTAHRLASDATIDVHAVIVSRERMRSTAAQERPDGRPRGG